MHCQNRLNYLSRKSSEEADAMDTLESSCRRERDDDRGKTLAIKKDKIRALKSTHLIPAFGRQEDLCECEASKFQDRLQSYRETLSRKNKTKQNLTLFCFIGWRNEMVFGFCLFVFWLFETALALQELAL